jgi:hypothetical protein
MKVCMSLFTAVCRRIILSSNNVYIFQGVLFRLFNTECKNDFSLVIKAWKGLR